MTTPQQKSLQELAGMDEPAMRFLLGFISLRHPDAYADARTAQDELAARNAAYRAQQEQEIIALLDPSGIWSSYASAIKASEGND